MNAEVLSEVVQEQIEIKPALKPAVPIKSGIATPTDIEGQYRLAVMYQKSGMLPARFKTPEQVLTAMHFAMEHFPGAPLTALRQIAVIEGTPTMFGDLPLAKVMATGKMAYKKEYFVDKDWKQISIENKNMGTEIFAAVCETGRIVGDNHMNTHVTTFSQEDAKKAGLWGRATWAKYPGDMLRYKARGRNLKDQFPDALNGVSQGEFDHDITLSDVENRVDGAAMLNERTKKMVGEQQA
jgi:hypothetical protein